MLMDAVSATVIWHLPGLHAKVYIADGKAAIITSANLTAGGLFRNYEYGVCVSRRALASRVRNDLLRFAELGGRIDRDALTIYARVADELRSVLREQRRSITQTIQKRFDAISRQADEHLIRQRLRGGSMHTVFTRTIEYLLACEGPLTTVELHPRIAAIHPDLCDDSIDRVIDGKRFGKKWKHAARWAQQELKRQGRATYDGKLWRLVPKD